MVSTKSDWRLFRTVSSPKSNAEPDQHEKLAKYTDDKNATYWCAMFKEKAKLDIINGTVKGASQAMRTSRWEENIEADDQQRTVKMEAKSMDGWCIKTWTERE